MRTGPPEPAVRVSTLELFFDLVFVFTVTQLTGVLAAGLTVPGVLRVMLMLGVILWMYGGYAWLTNAAEHALGTVPLGLVRALAQLVLLVLVLGGLRLAELRSEKLTERTGTIADR